MVEADAPAAEAAIAEDGTTRPASETGATAPAEPEETGK